MTFEALEALENVKEVESSKQVTLGTIWHVENRHFTDFIYDRLECLTNLDKTTA
jgi:hypothetical protein